ncbi:MAG TPA: serine/threonine-protein kinase [Ktedonobacteraceae bacterium]|nr:serine/threonine-protein kinase [Ktedonobacteraceae bacterium]
MALEELQNGRYHRVRLLGSGGMGEVHLMEDTRVSRRVAIKVIRSEAGSYPDSKEAKDAARLFKREARAIAALEHPNILPLYDFGEEIIDGTTVYYMVMPFCAEGTLADWQRQRGDATKLSVQDIAYIVDQAANALQYAHDHQVIHLDVKPSNFLIRSNTKNPHRPTVLLADFGLARNSATVASSSLTIRGTPTFMAPEQWGSNPVFASDQYALAIMIYQLLMGRPPFEGSMERLLNHHLSTQPLPPSTLKKDLTATIDSVILRALAKRPEDRFPSVTAFADAFEQAVQALPAPVSLSVEHIVEPRQSDRRDLRAAVYLTRMEANAGASRTITMPNGQPVTVSVPANVHDGEVIRVPVPDESPNSGKVVFVTIGIKQAEEPSSASDVLSAAPTLITPEPRVTPRASFGQDLPTIAASDSRAAAVEKQPAPSFPGREPAPRTRTRTYALISGLVILLLLAGTGLYFGVHLTGGKQTNANALSSSQTATVPVRTPASTPTVAATPTPPSGLYIAGSYSGTMANQLTGQSTSITVFIVQNQGSGLLSGSVTFKTSPPKTQPLKGTVDKQGKFSFSVQQSAGQQPLLFYGATQQGGTFLHGSFCNSTTNTCDSNTGFFTVGPRS